MSNKIYSWSIDLYGDKVNPQLVGKEMEKIEQTEGLNAENLVEYAKNPKSELNKCFEWDDTIAAKKYRLRQASNIIQNIRVEVINKSEEKRKVRAFVKTTTSHSENYLNIEAVVSDSDKYQLLLSKAYKELTATKYRYQDLEEIQDLLKDIPEIF